MAITDETIQTRRWSRREYERLVELGVLDEDEPIELLDGHLVVKEPQHTPHATAIMLVEAALRRVFGRSWLVRPQLPVALDPASEPEPDVCVVRGELRDYLRSHPSRPVLIVEVAESGLSIARMLKARLYARAGIREYWIIDLKGRALEVYRRPTGRARVPRYESVRRLGLRESIAPLAAPRRRLRVASLLP